VYDHPQDNSGIQRVVRNVVNSLGALQGKVEFIPVILKHDRVYQVTRLGPTRNGGWRPRLQAWLSLWHERFARRRDRLRLYRAARERTGMFKNSPFLRGCLALGCRSLSLCMAAPQKVLAHVSLNYVDKSRAVELQPRPDDVLVLLDSSWHADFFPVAERLKAQGIKIVSVIYDLIPMTHPQFCDEGLVRVFEQWFNWVCRTADGFIAISQ